MISFENDYNHGAHEKILQRLIETNGHAYSGYGDDEICESAKKKIRRECGCPEAEIFFCVGGTATNQLVIDTVLKDYQGVIAAATGHISTHEAGAIEYSGHKVIELPGADGKLSAIDLEKYMADFYDDGNHKHMVYPGMVYVTYPTEYGTLYTKKELEDIAGICHKYDMTLYLDGARLGYGLMSPEADMTLEDIARITDVFYIGGNKTGALFGEAIVFKAGAPDHYVHLLKKHGALLAKGWTAGLQFDVLFEDGLYYDISRHADIMADCLKTLLKRKGYQLYQENPTNQVFVVLENRQIKELQKQVKISFWEKYDETHTVMRFVTSWATRQEELDMLESLL